MYIDVFGRQMKLSEAFLFREPEDHTKLEDDHAGG